MKFEEKVYYRKKKYFKLSTLCGAFDVPHRKKGYKTIAVIADMYSQSMGGGNSSDQVMYSYTYDHKSKS